jgi:hypothetical protein
MERHIKHAFCLIIRNTVKLAEKVKWTQRRWLIFDYNFRLKHFFSTINAICHSCRETRCTFLLYQCRHNLTLCGDISKSATLCQFVEFCSAIGLLRTDNETVDGGILFLREVAIQPLTTCRNNPEDTNPKHYTQPLFYALVAFWRKNGRQ